jgi:hypothetical protein
MARFKDEAFVLNAFAPHLQPGERILYYAYGVKQPNILLIVLLLGGILAWLMTKEYMVGMTDRGRFIVLRFSGKLNVKEVQDYYIGNVQGVKTKTGPIFTYIDIKDPQKPFSAKFHRLGMKQNREYAMAIAQSLNTRQLAPPMAAAR